MGVLLWAESAVEMCVLLQHNVNVALLSCHLCLDRSLVWSQQRALCSLEGSQVRGVECRACEVT